MKSNDYLRVLAKACCDMEEVCPCLALHVGEEFPLVSLSALQLQDRQRGMLSISV